MNTPHALFRHIPQLPLCVPVFHAFVPLYLDIFHQGNYLVSSHSFLKIPKIIPTQSLTHTAITEFFSPPCPNVLYHLISWHLSYKSYLTAFTCPFPHQGKLLGLTSAKSIVWQRLEAQQTVAKWMDMKLIYCRVSVHWGINLEQFYFSNNCHQLCSVEPSLFLLGSRLPYKLSV